MSLLTAGPEQDVAGYKVRTYVDDSNGDIMQEVTSEFYGTAHVIGRQIMHTQEAQIRYALIKLGWTPPNEASKEE